MSSETNHIEPYYVEENLWELTLFVAGRNFETQKIFYQLKRICDDYLNDRFQINVVDVLEKPEEADNFDIIATPTLIRLKPQPVRRILGDLSLTEKVLSGLGIPHSEVRN